MGLAIERKFLVVGNEWRKLADIGQHIVQGYLCTDVERSVRVRICGNAAFITIQGSGMGVVRQEYEYPIPAPDATQMIESMCATRVISKWRYRVKHGSRVWEIDVFEGANEGLVTAEIELHTASETVSTPDWLDKEVSHDPRYLNSQLVSKPWREWGLHA